jgi:hypothetical protein
VKRNDAVAEPNQMRISLTKVIGFTDAAIRAYFARSDLRQALVHPLSDEVAAYFGWS